MTDRDTFAAAALTGLLSLNRPGLNQQFPTELCELAFRWADAMLREQDKQSVGVAEMDSGADRKSVATPRACARSCSQPFDSAPTTHDAVPEAIAYADGEPAPKCGGEAGLSPRDGTGNTQRPVAWVRLYRNGGPQSVYLDRPPPDAEPLYLSPTLTEAERDALEFAVETGRVATHDETTLRNLLERTK